MLHVDAAQAQGWSEEEVVERWCRLFKGHLLVERLRSGAAYSVAEQTAARAIIAEWRERLGNISWFMACLNQCIACQANKEDKAKCVSGKGALSAKPCWMSTKIRVRAQLFLILAENVL